MVIPNVSMAQEVTVGAFTGAGIDDGIDLTTDDGGEFVYAINIGGGEIQVGDLLFTSGESTPGATVDAENQILEWEGVNDFGTDPDDMALATVLHSIRWTNVPGSVTVRLENVEAGVPHRLQLITAEKCCDRGWNVMVDEELIAEDFSARALTDDADLTKGAILTYDFVPLSDEVFIDLNGEATDFPDRNPILSGVTLEKLGGVVDDPNLVTSSQLRFGQVASTPASSRTLTLRSLGASQPVTISEVRWSGPDAEHFTASAPPATIPVGETAELTVTFDAMNASGLFQGTLEVVSDDQSQPVLGIDVTASVINRNGPAANFTLDEAADAEEVRDVSGNDRHGVIVPGAGSVTPGVASLATGTAVRFADGGHVRVAGNQFGEPFDSFGVSLWMQPEALPEGLQTVFGKGDSETPTFALLTFGSSLSWFTGGEAPEFVSEPLLTTEEKQHVAVIYDNTVGARTLTVFLNGVAVIEETDPIEIIDSLDFNVVLGAYNGALPFHGVIDDVQIYDRLITAEDVVFLKDNPGVALGSGGAVDSDGDGLLDAAEVEAGTDPLVADTDGDGLEDGAEVNTHGTNPLLADTDMDGFGDGTELRTGSDPMVASSVPDKALEVSTFTGGDPGEGLDMEGVFQYAINIFGPGGSRVGDATFSDDTVAGFSVEAVNSIIDWHAPNYGDSENDNALELVLQSIRWDTAPVIMELENLTVGQKYILQLLFAENCCDRGYDIVINGELEADEFSPQALHGSSPTMGVVAKYTFTAESETLNVTLANDDANFPDTNPIINGLTLEIVSDGLGDNDTLPDPWEQLYFGDLSQTDDGDPDGDTLTNVQELDAGTDPTNPDSDGDGLTDAREVNETNTNPNLADSDDDGASDGTEVVTLASDPNNPDSDGDGSPDGFEASFGGDPNNGAVLPTPAVTATAFSGGDSGEGLDLDGQFVYAINMFGEGDLQIRDALFTDDAVEGFSYDQPNAIIDWHFPEYGDSQNDDNLEIVMQSIRWNAGPVNLSFDGLTAGGIYKLQLLFAENCCDRGWDIHVQGGKLLDDFNAQQTQGGIAETSMGAVVTVSVVSPGTSLQIQFINDAPAFPDNNPILNGLTLEEVASLDGDDDGLRDDWEETYFGNTDSGAEDDPDDDGLTNAEEFDRNTDPTNADVDGDGLNDGDEVAAGSDPGNADSDGDGLRDGDEVSTYLTSPILVDTDGDNVNDSVEIFLGSDPSQSGSVPSALPTATAFSGGDPGEGLDLEGEFLYAINLLGAGGMQIGDAPFTDDLIDGFTFDQPNEIIDWHAPEYGDSDSDNALEMVMQSIRWNAGPVNMAFAGLTPGHAYRLQLLAAESCCDRGWDILLDGFKVVDDFNASVTQGGINNTAMGAVVTVVFTASSDTLAIQFLDDAPAFPDNSPILNGLTLESLGEGMPGGGGEGDADNDGVSDSDEAIAGTNPNDAQDYLRVTELANDVNGVELVWPAIDGKSYDVEYSVDLENWEVIGSGLQATDGLGSYNDPDVDRTSMEGAYYRIVVR